MGVARCGAKHSWFSAAFQLKRKWVTRFVRLRLQAAGKNSLTQGRRERPLSSQRKTSGTARALRGFFAPWGHELFPDERTRCLNRYSFGKSGGFREEICRAFAHYFSGEQSFRGQTRFEGRSAGGAVEAAFRKPNRFQRSPYELQVVATALLHA